MKTLTLSYRDASNYKCIWEVDVPKSIKVKKSKNEDDFYDIKDLGLTMEDIPLIQEYGISDDDHCFVLVEKIERVG